MATYSVQAASPPAFITAHQYVSSHRAQFDSFDPPVATALPAANGHRGNQGSDCGSSSGLGGMKQEGGVSDDSASNHDGGSSAAEDITACIDVVPVSSKQSAASSGKGSSTGTSPTGPTRTVNSVKTRSSPKRQRTPLHIQATPSTSAAASDVLTLGAATTGSTASGSVVSLNGSTDYAATVAPAYPPPMSIYPRLMSQVPNHPPPPLYTMTVSSAGQLVDICQNRPTTNGGPAGAPLHSNGQPTTNGPLSSSTTGTTGQNASATSSTTGGRNSASPGDALPQSQPAGPVTSSSAQRTSNDLYVHVQPGETLAIRVGSDIQQISGPATVRMVSQNGHAPSALPLHVPPGHMIQQIVDELGNLRHLILSPETTPTGLMPNGPFGPMASTPVPPPPTINPNTPVPPSGTPTPQYGVHHTCMQAASPPPGVPPFPPPAIAGMPFAGHQVVGVDVDPQHVCPGVYDTTGYHHAYVQVRPSHWSPPPGTNSRPGKLSQDAGYAEEHDASQNSQSGASCVEDEETEKIKDMLNRIQSPQVLEAGSREAEISWQELDTSEASAPGGPFPQIDASEFTYEIVLFENKPDGRVFSNYRCTPDQGNQLRLCHLKPDTEYFVRLRALLAERGLLGEPSAPIGFKTKPTHPDKPLPPRLQKRGKSWFLLSWRRPSDNGSKISEFLLEMDEVRDGAKEAFKEAYRGVMENARVNHLQPNTLYRFRLTASNEYGQSDPSDIMLVQTNGAAPTAPDPPQLLDATPTTLQVAWTKRDTDDHFSLLLEDPTTAYGFLPYCANTSETVAIVRDLRRNSEYRFRLLANNDDGQSQPSEIVTFCTLPDRPNAPPKPYLKDRVKATSVTLAWDPPKDTGGADVTSYQLEYSADQTASPNVDPRTWKSVYSGANRGVAVHSLEPGQSYLFRLCVCGPAGQSSWSEVLAVSTTPIAPGVCSCPELVGRTKPTSIHIRWAPPCSTGGSPITDYEVTTRDSQSVYRGPKTDCQIAGLLPGRHFSLRVRAYNRTGPGAWSEPLDTTTAPGAPDSPTDLRLAAAAADKTLTLAWNAPKETNGAPISEYRLMRATRRSISLAVPDEETLAERRASIVSSALVETIKSSSSSDSSSVPATPTGPLAEFGEFSAVHTGSALSAEVKNLTPATDYAFKVHAVNASGVSAASRELICRTVAGPPSAPPKVALEAVSTTELDVNWEEPSGNGSPLIAYLVELSSDGDRRPLPPIQLPAHISQHLIDDLLPETLYKVRVSATNDVGSGPWATATCSTFSMPPPPPQLECVNVGAQSLKLRWQDTKNPVGDEKYYYYLEKENENGSYSPVFEGDSKSVKAKNLNESTRYRFRIRASSPTGGMGPWSEPIEFATSRLPPPSVKSAPRVTEVTDGSYQIEWQAIRAPGLIASDKIQYRLQTAIGSGRGGDRPEDWKTVYQGSAQSYTLSGQVPGTTFRVRVSSVRVSHDAGAMEETVAPPSNSAVINQPATPTKQPRLSDSTGATSESASPEAEVAVEPKLSDGHWAILILVGFSFCALLLAFFLQSFMGSDAA